MGTLPPGEPVPEFASWELALRVALGTMNAERKLALGRRMQQVGAWLANAGAEQLQAERDAGER